MEQTDPWGLYMTVISRAMLAIRFSYPQYGGKDRRDGMYPIVDMMHNVTSRLQSVPYNGCDDAALRGLREMIRLLEGWKTEDVVEFYEGKMTPLEWLDRVFISCGWTRSDVKNIVNEGR